MVDDSDKGHRSGIWKQQNKAHKTGRHRSKGQVDLDNKGRVSVKALSRKARKDLGRVNRRHHALQVRAKKREEVLQKKRNIGTKDAPPHLVAIVPLHRDTNIQDLLKKVQNNDDEDVIISKSTLSSAGFTINVPRLKHRFTFITPTSSSISDVLDCGLVADTVLFQVSCDAENPIDSQGDIYLSTLFAQGLSGSVLTLSGLVDVPIKKRADVKKSIQKIVGKNFPNPKLHSLDTEQDIMLMLRTVAEQKRKSINLRHKRPYLLADNFHFECEETSDTGTLAVSGFLRGECMDVNRLVHVVGWGDFQLNRIEAANDPLSPLKQRKQKNNKAAGDAMVVMDDADNNTSENVDMSNQEILSKYDSETRQNLIREAIVDPLDAEQTWPTDDEMREAEEAIKAKKKLVKKVPKGTSEYQAAWILESDEEWVDDEEEEDGDMEMEDEVEDFNPVSDEESQVGEEEFEQIRVSESTQDTIDNQFETASQYDEGMDFEEENRALERYREERSNQMFPDEMDTPHSVAARTRFQKYRGLRSFRTSPWDTKENLPLDYAKIFQFQNFDRTRKRIRMQDVDDSVKPGSYITIYLENVPKTFVESHSSQVIIYGMFPHEQKMSVVHVALKRLQGQYEDLTVKNKDEMLFYVGFRRFRARPLFSQHTNGDKHKMERYLSKEGVSVASIYSQITFPPANVIMFKETSSGIHPVASGNIFKTDPDRVVTKRIVLSGHPFRIHKRLATIRYMFFNKEDIIWFKPVELHTKWGRRGHIKEPLGTHGHMKCTFDAQLTSQDTVLMSLYKRVYPKWSYELVTPSNRVKTFLPSAGSDCSSLDRVREVRFDDEFFD